MLAVLDCDILSTFAKINKIELLEKLFSGLLMPYAVYVELTNAKSIGFNFPDRIFESRIELTILKPEELKDFKTLVKIPKIHYGEAEGIVIAKNRSAVFLTNDGEVVKLCEEEKILVLDLKDVLKQIARKNLVNGREMLHILDEIEKIENTLIKEKEDILKEYKK